ncbi:MAG: Ig-like domain-containing protein [Oscillospiraceae bacterium]|nr:Ig-like domain-containing protein [Oscillospiraceae bacterium]MBQ9930131.1 Ig-like domain-containing protein [Oscillospiraceae bacterium]
MNKVICDICGTSYPDTAPKCPICGYAKTTTETTSADTERHSSEGYTAVKGGRFSKQNVRKRNSGRAAERTGAERSRRGEKEEGGNTGLVLVVIFLLVAIVAVVIYIGIKLFSNPGTETQEPTYVQTTQPSTAPTSPTTAGIACESIQLNYLTIEFMEAGDSYTIVARPTPSNTTDEITFESSDPKIVTVDDTGLLTAVGGGEATITVTCGSVTQTCQIKCSFETPTDPTTDPTAPTDANGQVTTDPTTATDPTTPAGPVDPNFTFEFNTKWKDETSGKWDTSILEQGKTWKAYKNDLSVDPGAITWTTDDASICTVQNGIVTAVAPGKTEIHATYGGKTYTCIVRCKFEATGTTTPTQPTTDATTGATTAPTTPAAPVDFDFAFRYSVYDEATGKWDTTLTAGDTWTAYKNDLPVDPGAITWTTDDASVCTVKDGVVTAVGAGKTELHATYGGKTYTCIVRVKG